jgi:Raf kinase inhibitor-like YbhB/YbcL family protein
LKELSVKSEAFQNNQKIPTKYTCDGEGVNPPLKINGVPPETKSLSIILEDPDAPSGTFTHWLVWNISSEGEIRENSVPGVQGTNSSGRTSYAKPCPPSGTHHYIFKVYALDTELNLDEGTSRQELEQAMQDHVIAKGELTGLCR